MDGKLWHRFSLPTRRVAVDIFEDARLQDKKGAIYPTVSVRRLLTKAANVVFVQLDVAEAPRRANGRYSGKLTV
jgi:hypothetical protein